ncbi:MAG: hypothetical protein V4574_14125 [Pseudomonadota bacterium]
MADEGEQEEAMLRVRAMTLREIAKDTRVFAGTLAERDLERARAEIEEAIVAIEEAKAPYWAIADRLKAIARVLGGVLYMSGINAAGGLSVRELQAKLATWLDGA